MEALVLLADQVLRRHLEIVEEHLVGLVIDHGVEPPQGQALAQRIAHLHQQHREAVRALFDLLGRRRSHQQHHQVRLVRARGPDLLAVDDVAVAYAFRVGLDLGGVRAGGRLGHAEGLEADRSVGDARKVAALLLLAAVPQHRAHHVHLRMTGGRAAAGRMDLLENDAAGADRQPGAAVLLGDQRAEIARLAQLGDELLGIFVGVFQVAPIFVGIFPADGAHAVPDLREIRAERHHDQVVLLVRAG